VMTAHDSNKHAPSASHSGRSVLHRTHTDSCQNNQSRSSSSGRSSLTPSQLATVRSQDRLRYRMRCDRLGTQASHTNHRSNSRHRPQFTHLPISQTETHLSLQHASNVGLLLPQPDMTAHLQHHLISEVRRFGITSSDISVNSHTNSINIDFAQDSDSFEIAVNVPHPHEGFTVLQKTPQPIQHCTIPNPQRVDDVLINVRTLTLQDMLSM
ncbi:hypothetical protein FRX31_022610, partial [Thalictrum thalictroides]